MRCTEHGLAEVEPSTSGLSEPRLKLQPSPRRAPLAATQAAAGSHGLRRPWTRSPSSAMPRTLRAHFLSQPPGPAPAAAPFVFWGGVYRGFPESPRRQYLCKCKETVSSHSASWIRSRSKRGMGYLGVTGSGAASRGLHVLSKFSKSLFPKAKRGHHGAFVWGGKKGTPTAFDANGAPKQI